MKSKQKKRFLIVCTGNTCRSPMAAVVLNQLLEKEGLSEKYEATSAGVAAFDGQPATPNAVEVAKEEKLDLSGHKSRRITLEDIQEAEQIFVMTEDQRRLLSGAVPGAESKITVMRIPDPYGGDIEVYRDCFKQIRIFLIGYFKEHPLCAES